MVTKMVNARWLTRWSTPTNGSRGETHSRDETIDEMIQADPSELLVLYRQRSGWSQEELARRHDGISSRSIRNWEAGVNQPKPGSLWRLIEIYHAAGVFLPGREIDEARHLWQRVKSLFDGRARRRETYPRFDESRFALRSALRCGGRTDGAWPTTAESERWSERWQAG